MLIYYVSLAAGILLGVAAQLLLKVGASGEGGIIAQFLKPQSIIGLGLYGFAAVFYMLALRKIPVSVAFPSVALSYVVLAVLSNLWLKEPLGPMQIVALVLIVAGVVLLNQHA
ncbi:MAG TPA: EamA family transporter [Alphaproteobacteria bacterium]|nr:EamA family transporter [Alphaproteobacteria bacterium]